MSIGCPTNARAAEYYPVAGGSVTLTGHGFGHGIGMSIWGAYNAARNGASWSDITDFYYPGTARTSQGDPTIRVDVRSDFGSRVAVVPQGGMWATYGPDHGLPTPMPTVMNGQGIVTYQVIQVSGGLQLAYLTGDGWWHLFGWIGSQVNLTNRALGWFTATTTAGRQSVVAGELRAISTGGTTQPVVALPMEQYVRGVVPHESPPSWPAGVLGAQAVAARSFATAALAHPRSTLYDICDTTSCQVYSGTDWYASTDAAVASTARTVLTYGGTVANTMFSASNGGYSASGSAPYLVARADPWTSTPTDPYRDWSVDIPAAKIQSAWPSIGSLTGVRVDRRDGAGDWGGRVLGMTFVGTTGQASVTGDQVRGALGLRSTYFTPVLRVSSPTFPLDMTGDGRADVMWTAATGPGGGYLMLTSTDGAGHVTGTAAYGWIPWPGAPAFPAGTWDADAISDLMIVDPSGTLQLWSGANIGAGSRPVMAGASTYERIFPFGDFDGDGFSDLGARRGADGTFWLIRGNGSGGVKGDPIVVSASMGDLTTAFCPGDMNGDGTPDLLVVGRAGNVAIVFGDGIGHFLAFAGLGGAPDPTVVRQWSGVGDVDGDGRADLLALGYDEVVTLYHGNGNGSVSPVTTLGRFPEVRTLTP